MNTMEELAYDVARRWDGHSTARNLVRDYGREVGFPLWFTGDLLIPRDNLAFYDDTEELIELVTEEIYGEYCEPMSVTNIGKRRPVWA